MKNLGTAGLAVDLRDCMAGMLGCAKENLTGGLGYSQTLSMIMIWLKEYHMNLLSNIYNL